MTPSAQNLISTFDQLPESEKKEVVAAILHRTLQLEFLPLSDEEMVLSAEQVFLELDRGEAEDAQP